MPAAMVWLLVLFLGLTLFGRAAHAQPTPTQWASYQRGSMIYYSGTDGGQWAGKSYKQWGTRFYEFTGPDGQTQHCSAYALPGARNTECFP